VIRRWKEFKISEDNRGKNNEEYNLKKDRRTELRDDYNLNENGRVQQLVYEK